MSRAVSYFLRAGQDAEHPEGSWIVLVKITHAALPEPVRLSSNGARISEEPLRYGTMSTWLTDDESPFQFIMMGVQPPDETQQGFGEGALVLELVSSKIAETLTSTTVPAIVDMAIVMAETPNYVEWQSRRMRLRASSGDNGQVRMTFSRWPFRREAWPPHSFSRDKYPGLFG